MDIKISLDVHTKPILYLAQPKPEYYVLKPSLAQRNLSGKTEAYLYFQIL